MSRSKFSWRLAIPTGMAQPIPARTGNRARVVDFIVTTTVKIRILLKRVKHRAGQLVKSRKGVEEDYG